MEQLKELLKLWGGDFSLSWDHKEKQFAATWTVRGICISEYGEYPNSLCEKVAHIFLAYLAGAKIVGAYEE